MRRAVQLIRTVPASVFGKRVKHTDAVDAAVKDMERRLMESFGSRIDELEKASVSNRAQISTNRAQISTNRAQISMNRAEIAKLKRWREDRDFILIFRERSRIMLQFFNAIYKTWVEDSPEYSKVDANGKKKKKLDMKNGLQNDFKHNMISTGGDAKFRHERARRFLDDMWSGFGGTKINIATWRNFLHFVEATNTVCHSLASIGERNNARSVIEREVGFSSHRLDRDVTLKLLNMIIPLLVEFGTGLEKSWTKNFADETAFKNRSRFKKFPDWWPR